MSAIEVPREVNDRTVTLFVTDPLGNAVAAGDGATFYWIPGSLDGYRLISAHAHVSGVSSAGAPTIQIRNVTDGVDMLSTRITIDQGETSSRSAAAPAVVNAANALVQVGDQIAVDIDVAGTDTKGLVVELVFA